VVINSTGKVSLSGTALVTSANMGGGPATTPKGTIYLAQTGVSSSVVQLEINSNATVENTTTLYYGNAIYNASPGTINIFGGTVQASGQHYTIYNSDTGIININAIAPTTIKATGSGEASKAIFSSNGGKVNITGSPTIIPAYNP